MDIPFDPDQLDGRGGGGQNTVVIDGNEEEHLTGRKDQNSNEILLDPAKAQQMANGQQQNESQSGGAAPAFMEDQPLTQEDDVENPVVIKFDQAQHVFNAGDFMTGRVLLDLQEMVECDQFQLKIVGFTRTTWVAQQKGNRSTRLHGGERIRYEVYPELHFVTKLLSHTMLMPGRHVILFEQELSDWLPSSFACEHGEVGYYCRATVKDMHQDKGQRTLMKCKRPFYVVSNDHLDDSPGLRTPVDLRDEYVNKVCCITMGAISVKLAMEKRGFVCGEMLPATVHIANHSYHRLMPTEVTLRLTQTIRFQEDQAITGTKEVHEITQDVQLIESPRTIEPNHTYTFDYNSEEFQMLIPALPPTYMDAKDLIYITYDVSLKVGEYVALNVPIKIGTVPFVKKAAPERRRESSIVGIRGAFVDPKKNKEKHKDSPQYFKSETVTDDENVGLDEVIAVIANMEQSSGNQDTGDAWTYADGQAAIVYLS